MTPPPIPHPDDSRPLEFDAPPPAQMGKPWGIEFVRRLITRPARAGVDNPSEKSRPGLMPDYHAPAPGSSKRK